MLKIYLLLAISLCFSNSIASNVKAIKVKTAQKKVHFLNDVKPILDKRCVTCHSCYNSPCQAKFSSFEGIDRGASKLKVYHSTRIKAIKPTRLFIDAQTTNQWQKKGFYSLTQSRDYSSSHNDSIMIQMLHQKKQHPEIIGSYAPESDDLVCPKDKQELDQYFKEKPNHGMPYGFPAIDDSEHTILANWLHQGAKGPTAKEQKQLTSASPTATKDIEVWEQFLNQNDAKHKMTARYLYEHLYIAHLNFESSPSEFFKIVRSYSPAPKAIKIIPTLRPFDDPGVSTFYYRLEKIHSTIVHKTHITFELGDKKLKRLKALFIEPKWLEKPHVMTYAPKISANPFLSFAQIPSRSRYQFLLDNAHYILKTFIRGPVCRGQIALNVINDHFWIMFKDLDFDLTVQHPEFLITQAENLSLPIENVNSTVFKAFSDEYREKHARYYEAKVNSYDKKYPDGLSLKSIWKGNFANDAPLLTIYRHFDSASVHKGVIGEKPRTMWVMDFPQLERVYYSLVAGYDVFGNVTHQTNIRRYTDFLRIEAEKNFLSYMPKETRLPLFKSWYIGDSSIQKIKSLTIEKNKTLIPFNTKDHMNEFIQQVISEHILKTTDIQFDPINYTHADKKIQLDVNSIKTKEEFMTAIRSITKKGMNFIDYLSDQEINNIFIRVKFPDNHYQAVYLVINRWHDNVNSLFKEDKRLNPKKDTIDFLPMSVGSYPNMYVDVNYQDFPDFFETIINYKNNEQYKNKVRKYLIKRSNNDFWNIHDWFQIQLNIEDPIQSGLYDLNRYYRKVW